MLYYIVSLLISVGVDAVLYCLYKWLDKKWKQPDTAPIACKGKSPEVAASGDSFVCVISLSLHSFSLRLYYNIFFCQCQG